LADSTIKSLWAVPLIHSRQYKIIHFVQCKKLVYCRAVRNSYFAEVQDTCREKLSYVEIIYEQYNLFIMSNKNFFYCRAVWNSYCTEVQGKVEFFKKKYEQYNLFISRSTIIIIIIGQYETHILQKYSTLLSRNRKNLGISNIVQKPWRIGNRLKHEKVAKFQYLSNAISFASFRGPMNINDHLLIDLNFSIFKIVPKLCIIWKNLKHENICKFQ
jgi:hypothetical protein